MSELGCLNDFAEQHDVFFSPEGVRWCANVCLPVDVNNRPRGDSKLVRHKIGGTLNLVYTDAWWKEGNFP